MFKGKVKIEEGDMSGNYFEWVASYTCARCTIPGVQNIKAEKDKFPEGINDEDIAKSVLDLIERNHRCLALDTVDQIRRRMDQEQEKKAKGIIYDVRGRILH